MTRRERVLMVLRSYGGEPVSERTLAKITRIPRTSLRRVIDSLEQEGLIGVDKGRVPFTYRLRRPLLRRILDLIRQRTTRR